MSEPPSIQDLVKRITSLEQYNASLKGELRQARAELADLGAAFKLEVTQVTAEFGQDRTELKHIYKYLSDIHRYLADIHDQLGPLMNKVFPGRAETQRQITAIMRNGGRSWDDKTTR